MGKRKSNCLWLAVTPDIYEFPIYIEESARELAEKLGIPICTVFESIRKDWNGKQAGRKIIRVYIDKEEG